MSMSFAAPIRLTALGASTCFGGHVTAAAAARAGMVRFRPLPLAHVLDGETGESELVLGAPAALGFEGVGKVVCLAMDAMDDLRTHYASLSDSASMGVAFAFGSPVLGVPAPRDDLRDVPFEQGITSAQQWADAVVSRIVGHRPLRSVRRQVFLEERTGTIAALRQAMQWIREGDVEQALVIAADSAIDPGRLAVSLEQGRLKTPDLPVGFIPGEAAVALLLEPMSGFSDGGALALLHEPVVQVEVTAANGISMGRTLSAVLTAAAARAEASRGTLCSDLNGEVRRAAEFGNALTRLPADSVLRRFEHTFPATAFGETGAAGPLLGIALAARAFARGYGNGTTIVLSTSNDGTRAAVAVQRSN